LIEAVASLQPGQAKAVMAEAGQTPERVRARIMYAAKTCDVKLQIAIQGDRVLFALRNGRGRRRRS
jgi:ribosomal protein L30E